MDIIEIKSLDTLTKDYVNILTQKCVELDGVIQQVGSNHRRGYQNSVEGRELLLNSEPQNIIDAVMAIWGDIPTE